MISMIRVVLYNLIELLTCYIGNEIIIKVPFSKKRLCIIIVMITDVVSVVLYKIFINRGYEDVITLLIILIMPLCCEKKNWKKTFPLAVIIMMITDLINSFVLYIISGIMSKDYTNYYNFSFLSLFGRSFSLIVFIIYYKFYLKNSYNKKMIAIKSYQSLILICGLLCCCIMFAGYFVVM